MQSIQMQKMPLTDGQLVMGAVLCHILLVASLCVAGLIQGEDGTDFSMFGGGVAGMFFLWVMFSYFFSFIIAMFFGAKIEALGTNLFSGMLGSAFGVMAGVFVFSIFLSMDTDGFELGDFMEGYFEEMFLEMSLGIAATGLAGAYIGGLGKTTGLPTFSTPIQNGYVVQPVMQQQYQQPMQQQYQQPMQQQYQQPMQQPYDPRYGGPQ